MYFKAVYAASRFGFARALLKEATNTVRSPSSTDSPACVTLPPKTSAVPAGGVSTKAGALCGLTCSALAPDARLTSPSVADQKLVPPPTNVSPGQGQGGGEGEGWGWGWGWGWYQG